MRTADSKLQLLVMALSVMLLARPEAAFAAGNAQAGKALAAQWCQSCHIIGPGVGVASDGAPPFEEVAADPATNEDGLRAWLFDPHPPMPNLGLSQRQIDDLTAYILSLAPQ